MVVVELYGHLDKSREEFTSMSLVTKKTMFSANQCKCMLVVNMYFLFSILYVTNSSSYLTPIFRNYISLISQKTLCRLIICFGDSMLTLSIDTGPKPGVVQISTQNEVPI